MWWPGIDQHIEEMVRACVVCVRSGKSLQPNPVPLHPIPCPTKPLEETQIDVVGELQGALNNYRYLIVVHDLNSKWPEICPT